MKDLTIIILTYNEEDVIEDAISSSLGFAEEIIVVDSGSTDSTINIIKKKGVKLVSHQMKDFSDQRNFAISYAHTNWVLFLDADERLTEEFKSEAESTIKNFDPNSNIGGYFVKRKTFYYGKNWNLEDKVQRLFFREKFIEWKGKVHETPKIKGEFDEIKAPILHFTHRNLSQMVKKTNEWSDYEASLRFNANHPPIVPWRFIRVMLTDFFKSYIQNKGYKNGTHGLIEALYQSFSIFITYAKLWELQNKKK